MRELHQSQRLAIALGIRHAESAIEILLGVAPLLVADHHHRAIADQCQSTDDRRIVTEVAIAVQLGPLGKAPLDIVERVRPARVLGQLHALEWSQRCVDVAPQRLGLALEVGQFRVRVEPLLGGVRA